MKKHKIISVISLITIVTLFCLAWEKKMATLKHNYSIVIDLGDYQFTGEPKTHEDVIYFVKNNKCKAFNRTCPHLGCKVEVDENNNCISCPCHGSKFSYDGEPLSGPADEKLQELKCEVDQKNNQIRIYTYSEN